MGRHSLSVHQAKILAAATSYAYHRDRKMAKG